MHDGWWWWMMESWRCGYICIPTPESTGTGLSESGGRSDSRSKNPAFTSAKCQLLSGTEIKTVHADGGPLSITDSSCRKLQIIIHARMNEWWGMIILHLWIMNYYDHVQYCVECRGRSTVDVRCGLRPAACVRPCCGLLPIGYDLWSVNGVAEQNHIQRLSTDSCQLADMRAAGAWAAGVENANTGGEWPLFRIGRCSRMR